LHRENLKAAADKVSGVIKDTAGKLMQDQKLEKEGKADKAKGETHKQMGDLKKAENAGQFGDD
jgi:uncharacterized protein YjbJ (UPF0337 family)